MNLHLSRSWLIAIAIVVAVVFWMASGTLSEPPAPEAQGQARVSPTVVATREFRAEPMTSTLILTGRTVAERTVEVKAETAGIVVRLGADRGASVAENVLLIQLANEDRDVRLAQARSRLAQVETSYDAVRSLEREGYQAQIQLAQARADLDAARAGLRLAELELARTSITAPIAGIVNERSVEVGDFVDRGQPLATLIDLDPIRVIAQVSERYLGQIGVGGAGTARMLTGETYDGTISYVGHIAGDTTRTFPVELEIANADGRLIEGITAELSLPIKQIFAHRVPASAISLADDGVLGVKALGANETVSFHAIEVLGDSGDGLWVGGLPEQLQVITTGQAFVQPGERVLAVTVAAD